MVQKRKNIFGRSDMRLPILVFSQVEFHWDVTNLIGGDHWVYF